MMLDANPVSPSALSTARAAIRDAHAADEQTVLTKLISQTALTSDVRASATRKATELVQAIRDDDSPGLMDVFLAEYGLSNDEGVALMCLAEALLRVPDAETIDALIEDKIAPSDWGVHLGQSSSSLVNASTWALMLTGRVLSESGAGVASVLHGMIRRLGEPVIRAAVLRAIREMGNQFVLGETIPQALDRGAAASRQGYTFSYDMLGEAALTEADAAVFFDAYADAIRHLSSECRSNDIRSNPEISVKLSALHPRYEWAQRDRVMADLVPRLLDLARSAKHANMGLNVDAEEADRLELSLDVIEAVVADPSLAGWDGFGVVVQAYGKRAAPVIEWLDALAEAYDRRLMVRLVKGAYWDTEIKRAQVAGLDRFPVYTRKVSTDVSYVCCAGLLLSRADRLYPQFATHNAHTAAAILELAGDVNDFEFQRLHGMGEILHRRVRNETGARCRIYAPVGAHRDLLAYLVRRLLENGANSSFVNQIVDKAVPAEDVASDPFDDIDLGTANPAVTLPNELYRPERTNAAGWDLADPAVIATLDEARGQSRSMTWNVGPLCVTPSASVENEDVFAPADPADLVGQVALASADAARGAIEDARPWDASANQRCEILNRAADLYEANAPELFAILAREAGKTLPDAVAELREAVDFLRYYAARARELTDPPRGVFACISPWNFPLAIFTGQVAGALAAGNAVVAKPAEATPIVAARAIAFLHQAGVPLTALQFLPGTGSTVGAALASDPGIDGVAFTGSTATAQVINRAMARSCAPDAPLIAETGGLNAMIVDSTALPEQAVRDIVESAFQSSGQRCSALRMLYVQEDVAETLLPMLFGAMDALTLGNPWDLSTDVGPVIDASAKSSILHYVDAAHSVGGVMKEIVPPDSGHFVGPTVIRVPGIEALEREVFGPVLHVATFAACDLDAVIDAINATGYGLTFGLHTRIDGRIENVARRVSAGNLYVNRNQIGAIVGSQPFGGHGLSGTGPKAGGPRYLQRFGKTVAGIGESSNGPTVETAAVQNLLAHAEPRRVTLTQETLPGPTGESNRYATRPLGTVLCLGPGAVAARAQIAAARAAQCHAVGVADGLSGKGMISGTIDPIALTALSGVDAVAHWGSELEKRTVRQALAAREGALIPLMTDADIGPQCVVEQHLCIDTTATGGNAELLAAAT